MKLSHESLKVLTGLVMGNAEFGVYRTRDDLEKLFHSIGGARDDAMFAPSRYYLTLNTLETYNGTSRLVDVLKSTLRAQRYIDREEARQRAVEELNKHFRFDGYEVVLDRNSCRVQSHRGSEVAAENVDYLSDEFVGEQLEKCQAKMLGGDYDGAISNARSLIEGVLAKIHITMTGHELEKSGDLQRDFRKVRELLNMAPDKYTDESIRQILNGFSSVIHGIDSLSNQIGDRHRRKFKPAIRHARLATNAAKTVVAFLIDNYRSQRSESSLS